MGDYVFKQGDQGDFLYFLNSGRVDIILENGAKHQRLTSLGAGDFFGEAALLSNKPRSASVKCITPCKLTRISKSSLDRMMKSAKSASANLREVDLMRQISRAKSVLQAVAGVTHHTIAPGAAAVTQGEEGQSMYS
jgi:CRP-like cAMP-binding protein